MTQVIIQAGGRGSRLENYTTNRPKCLVPVDGKPLLYHTFDAFPGASFTVIVDYRGEVVRRYLDAFPPGVPVRVVEADGDGTCGGIARAAAGLEQDDPAVIVWSDLLFREPPEIPADGEIYVGTTTKFPCRVNVGGAGVIGLFAVPAAWLFNSVPKSGEFTDWVEFPIWKLIDIPGVREFNTADALRQHWDAAPATRFFNSVEIGANWVEKRARLPEFQPLIENERAWYAETWRRGFRDAPYLWTNEGNSGALITERVHGRHPFDMPPSAATLTAIMATLHHLHGTASSPTDRLTVREMYLDKTLARLAHIPKLAPDYAVRPEIEVNGRLCRNVLHEKHRFVLQELLATLTPESFAFIHGDPTFSNILVDDAGSPWLIDPRGRFGRVQFYGDPAYDWAKLWYSVAGSYDAFNRRRFVLEMDGASAQIDIAPSGWEPFAPMFADRLGEAMMRRVRVLHGLIWLSLSGYVTEDYDQVLGAWFEGMRRLEEGLS